MQESRITQLAFLSGLLHKERSRGKIRGLRGLICYRIATRLDKVTQDCQGQALGIGIKDLLFSWVCKRALFCYALYSHLFALCSNAVIVFGQGVSKYYFKDLTRKVKLVERTDRSCNKIECKACRHLRTIIYNSLTVTLTFLL